MKRITWYVAIVLALALVVVAVIMELVEWIFSLFTPLILWTAKELDIEVRRKTGL